MTNAQRAQLWDEINRYVVACGGDSSKRVYGNTPRQVAVSQIEKVVREVEAAWANDMRKVTDECESLRADLARVTAENARLREAMPTDEERYELGMALDSARPAFLVVFPWLARLDAARKEVL